MRIYERVRKLEAKVTFLESQNRDDLREVMINAMAIYLDEQVEFGLSTEGKIKELMK